MGEPSEDAARQPHCVIRVRDTRTAPICFKPTWLKCNQEDIQGVLSRFPGAGSLRVELPAHGAQPGLPRLPLLQLPVQLLLQLQHVPAGAGRGGHLLHPELLRLLPLPAREAAAVTGATGRPAGTAGPGPAPLTAAAGWRSGAPAAAAWRRSRRGCAGPDSAGTREGSAVRAAGAPRHPRPPAAAPASPPAPLTAAEALSAAATPAAPPWRPRARHHGDRAARPAQARRRPGGRKCRGRKRRRFRGHGRHGGGGGAAERAAAAPGGGGGEGRAAKPPAQLVAAERGAAGPGGARQQVGRPSRSGPRSARPRRSTPPVVPQVAPAEKQVRAEEPLPARQEEPQPQPAPRRLGLSVELRFPEPRPRRVRKAPLHSSVPTGPCIVSSEQREGLGQSGAPAAQLRLCHHLGYGAPVGALAMELPWEPWLWSSRGSLGYGASVEPCPWNSSWVALPAELPSEPRLCRSTAAPGSSLHAHIPACVFPACGVGIFQKAEAEVLLFVTDHCRRGTEERKQEHRRERDRSGERHKEHADRRKNPGERPGARGHEREAQSLREQQAERELYNERRREQRQSSEQSAESWQAESKPKEKPAANKEKPSFELSGALLEDTNTFRGVVIKYSEPPEARIPKTRWRLYPFKNDEFLPVMYIHRQSAYLLGRHRRIADIPIDHPSCSKQHAVFQY
ncbi:hypothetical protein DV515_00019064, partial [Chloebia gouldiae]